MYNVFVHKPAAKKIDRLPRNLKGRILKLLDLLSKQPYLGKRLRGELQGSFRLRLGDYRIIYDISESDKKVIVHAIGSRGDVYK